MAAMLVSDIDFEERVRASFARQKVMATIGAELTQVTPGMIEIEMPFSEELTQQHGFLHAGVISTALDSACGYAAYSLMPADAAATSVPGPNRSTAAWVEFPLMKETNSPPVSRKPIASTNPATEASTAETASEPRSTSFIGIPLPLVLRSHRGASQRDAANHRVRGT